MFVKWRAEQESEWDKRPRPVPSVSRRKVVVKLSTKKKTRTEPTVPKELQLRWRIGQYRKTSSPVMLNTGDGASDPFSAFSYPIDYFHQQLYPLIKQSYIAEHLRYAVPGHDDPGSAWINTMVLRNIHGAYLYSYGAIANLRQGILDSRLDEGLAELNVMLSANSFYNNRMEERKMHATAARNIIHALGGLVSISPIFRAVYLISVPVSSGRTLAQPAFPSSDFGVPTWESLPPEYKHGIKLHATFPVTEIPSKITDLFQEHQQYLQIYRQRADFRRECYRGFRRDPVQEWLDVRFHLLSIKSLEVYREQYNTDPHVYLADEQANIDNQMTGVLVLALTFCNQFIYHHTRTKTGLFGSHPAASPIYTISFFNLRTHLQQLFEMEQFNMNDQQKHRSSIAWALFVLASLEEVESVHLSRSREKESIGWAEPLFNKVVRSMPPEEQSFDRIRETFSRFLYDSTLDPFLRALFPWPGQ